MSVQLLIYEVYKDSVWRQMANKEPVIKSQYILNPAHSFDSELVQNWKVYMIESNSNLYLPPKAHVGAFLQFGPEDAGADYNMTTPAGYKTVKYGKEFKNYKADPLTLLAREDFNHDTWEEYSALDKEICWQIGGDENKFIVQIFAEKQPGCEARRNYETCELALYMIKKIYIHVSGETQEKIKLCIDDFIKRHQQLLSK